MPTPDKAPASSRKPRRSGRGRATARGKPQQQHSPGLSRRRPALLSADRMRPARAPKAGHRAHLRAFIG
jgi:hypothetical protein